MKNTQEEKEETEKTFGEKVLDIVNYWGECTSESGIYWETRYKTPILGEKGGKDPEEEIVKEVNKLLEEYIESIPEILKRYPDMYKVWCREREIKRLEEELSNLSKNKNGDKNR